ncbi:MAG TPA: ATP-binding protein [Acidobacteriota bacterium]|nr:ATP-binding protein [Acidobacteriota bacterium]
MANRGESKKVAVIALMIGGILCLHYFTFSYMRYHHAVYRMLFYLPLVLGCFWFGLKGAWYVSAGVTIFYLPYLIKQWQGFSFDDFQKILEGVLFIVIAFILGWLVEKERKKHAALVQAERFAATGKALLEIAHDMKTPLIAIGGFAGQILRGLRHQGPNEKKLNIVIQETARLESMVRGMLDFGAPIKLQPTETDLKGMVREAIAVAEPMARINGVTLKVDLEPSLPTLIMLDAPRAKQVLLNLISNAVGACPDGGQVTVRTLLEDHAVVLTVTDCGCGIPEEYRDRIFDPFFSTKQEGTGLGLGIVKKIVEAHGGEVSFYSNAERGVTFTVRFPFLKSWKVEEERKWERLKSQLIRIP